MSGVKLYHTEWNVSWFWIIFFLTYHNNTCTYIHTLMYANKLLPIPQVQWIVNVHTQVVFVSYHNNFYVIFTWTINITHPWYHSIFFSISTNFYFVTDFKSLLWCRAFCKSFIWLKLQQFNKFSTFSTWRKVPYTFVYSISVIVNSVFLSTICT